VFPPIESAARLGTVAGAPLYFRCFNSGADPWQSLRGLTGHKERGAKRLKIRC